MLHTNVSICELHAAGKLRFSVKHILTLTCKTHMSQELIIYFGSLFHLPLGAMGTTSLVERGQVGG